MLIPIHHSYSDAGPTLKGHWVLSQNKIDSLSCVLKKCCNGDLADKHRITYLM